MPTSYRTRRPVVTCSAHRIGSTSQVPIHAVAAMPAASTTTMKTITHHGTPSVLGPPIIHALARICARSYSSRSLAWSSSVFGTLTPPHRWIFAPCVHLGSVE